MAPRKRTKRAHSPTPQDDTTAQSSADTPSSDSAGKPDPDYDLISDPWTDEQETALLKAIIKWKPVGIHKHFRMLAISDYLKSQGYAPATAAHMRIPGIWKKLETLYNLEALDEREDSLITDSNEDDDSPSEMYCPFELPYDDYGDMMFERRLAIEDSLSPVASRASRAADSQRGSTVADTDEPRSSPVPRGRKSNRSARPSTRGTRSTRLQVELGSGGQGKTSDEGGDSADETGANEEEEEEEGDGGSDGNTDEAEGEEDEKGGSRSTRAQTSRSKAKDAKPLAGTATRRTGRRR